MNLIDLYGSPPWDGNSPWDRLTTEPGLTYAGDDGMVHTVAQDFGPREGRWVAFESDTGGRVYIYGHPDDEALDVALETPVARMMSVVTGDNLDGDVAAPAPHYEFGWRYLVADEDREEDREDDYHISSDGSLYDLDTGYGPVWINTIPPAGAIARVICSYLAHATEVEVEDLDKGTDVRIGSLSFTAPKLILGDGEYTSRTIDAFVAHLTAEVYEFDSADHYPQPDRAKYPPVWRIMYPVYDGFWSWFHRALAAYGFDDFVVRSNQTHLTFYSDGVTCSGQEG